MSHVSVDRLQKILTEKVFHYAKDAKKAAGRALGTLVEVITFYAIESWGFERFTAIERRLPEYCNDEITHNVEYSLHPSSPLFVQEFGADELPITTRKIILARSELAQIACEAGAKSNQLLTRDLVLRNACTVCDMKDRFVVAYLAGADSRRFKVYVAELRSSPYAIFECKRVGVEEGMRKGPQTIEKAKQGAYVARTLSALQKIRLNDGRIGGLVQREDGTLYFREYRELLDEIINSESSDLLRGLVLTVGVVSNHGNWFTSDDHNKELKVLAQSYDWLLFLSDEGLAQFINDLVLRPNKEYQPVRDAFLASYTGAKGANRFTKVRMALPADRLLRRYFAANTGRVQSWFNIIAPAGRAMAALRQDLETLSNKNWKAILG